MFTPENLSRIVFASAIVLVLLLVYLVTLRDDYYRQLPANAPATSFWNSDLKGAPMHTLYAIAGVTAVGLLAAFSGGASGVAAKMGGFFGGHDESDGYTAPANGDDDSLVRVPALSS
jgi:hypothetical protein